MENKRYEYRTPIQIIVDHLKPAPEQAGTVKGYILELSASGVRIETATPLAEEQEVLVSFLLVGGYTVLNARVRIKRVLEKTDEGQIVAGEFVQLPETDQYKIREFIVWKEAQGEKPK